MLRLLRYNEKAYCKRTYNVFGRLRGLDAAENGPIQGAKVFYKKKKPKQRPHCHSISRTRKASNASRRAKVRRHIKRQDVIK